MRLSVAALACAASCWGPALCTPSSQVVDLLCRSRAVILRCSGIASSRTGIGV